MNWHIKNAKIIAPHHPLNGTVYDILIKNSKVLKIEKNIPKNGQFKEISSPNLHVSAGWLDMRANFPDPGFELKENITSGLSAAAAGGFTAVGVLPNTWPIRQTKSDVLYAIKAANDQLVDLIPYGAISENLEGKNLAELYDMFSAGALAFTDGLKSVNNSNLMFRALLYAKGFNALIINTPNDKDLNANGQINEGKNSTLLGLKGMPAIAEELMVSRDIELLKYTDGKLHIGPISTAKSVDLIAQALKSKLNVSAEVAMMNLIFTDDALQEFDTNYKVFPPLRTEDHKKALIKGLLNNDIQVITSNHQPEIIENKDVEFDHAAFGANTLETFYSMYNMHLADQLPTDVWIEKVSLNPRRILGLPKIEFAVGERANFTLFDPSLKWKYTQENKFSLSNNSPLINQELQGKIIGVINGTRYFFN